LRHRARGVPEAREESLRIRLIAAFLIACFGPLASAAPITLKDDLGRTVTVDAPVKRIVTLAPFLTELAFAIGAGHRVVGVSAYSDYPAEAKSLPVVSSALGVSLEQVAALKPDLVIAWKDSFRVEDIDPLQRVGAAVYVAHGRRLEDVPGLLRVLGTVTGLDAGKVAARFQSELRALRERYAKRPTLNVFLEIWHTPLTTISGGHFMNDALEICGARNVFKDLPGVAPNVSWEDVYARDPSVIIGTGSASNEAEFLANWKERPTLSAVKAGRLEWINPDTLQRPTTRTPQGIEVLCERLDRRR
jgi:iron complex transport system substrate-binding protein